MKPVPFDLYLRTSMIRGGFDRSRSSSSLGSSHPPTRDTNASRAPSGDQTGFDTPCR